MIDNVRALGVLRVAPCYGTGGQVRMAFVVALGDDGVRGEKIAAER